MLFRYIYKKEKCCLGNKKEKKKKFLLKYTIKLARLYYNKIIKRSKKKLLITGIHR